MQDEHIVWITLVGVTVSTLFFTKNLWHHYVVLGITVALLSFLKPRQPVERTGGPVRPSSEAQNSSGPGGFFHKARNFVINNPIMTYIQGEDKTPRIMELLSNHIIPGAAHDDCARAYPPRCHPGTRLKILERLTTWFYNVNRVKSILWLSGPAGVGKSAIMQTFAESVEQPVASVFVSRPNKRNDPNRIFTTIAYQLAVRIDAYRSYVVDRLAVNPYILSKNLHIQFQIFIIEPFAEKKIGIGGPPVAILLDGLDEIHGADSQREVIRLISTFTQEHSDVPLAWIMTSRPEPHISNTFNEITVRGRCESESIPIHSIESCEDVDHFLRDSFDGIRHDFPDTTLSHWPEETALAKLAAAASGLFIFAETAIRFIRDHDHSNPIPRLKLILSAIDLSAGVSIKERPFAVLDNLYTEILSTIPPELLPTTKLLMRLALSFHCADRPLGPLFLPKSQTLRGMTMILQLDRCTVYAALNKCFSALGIPPWTRAHYETLTFLHASFADYLMDPQRSGVFYIDINGVEDDILLFYLDLWHKHFGENSRGDTSLVNEQYNEAPEIAPDQIDTFNTGIFQTMAGTLLTQIVERHKHQGAVLPALQQKRVKCLDSLRRVNMISLCNSEYLGGDEFIWTNDTRKDLFSFVRSAFHAWEEFSQELGESGILFQISFKDLNFDSRERETYKVVSSALAMPSAESVDDFLRRSPELPVLICGMVPGGRIALFKGSMDGERFCIVPYRK